MRGFVAGFVAAIVLAALVIFLAIETGSVPARADGPLMPGEKWASNTSLNATIRREEPKPPYPYYPPSDADLVQGAKLYVQNCAVCHGVDHSSPDSIALGLGVRAPQFTKHGVDDDPEGETYWKIEHGIRFTGMPAFDKSMDETSIWQLTYFLKRLPKQLPPAALAIWNDPKSVAPPTPIPQASQSPGQGSTHP
ncbi:MAG TPA: cytochrome c [Candidatus Baltobacteraceae bacterium]|nr:cytochrome c [Candidatus Baltobacteraceae bacterium]